MKEYFIGGTNMTNEEKSSISKLQKKGYGYRKIATELDLSPNTVKSYLKKLTEDIICPSCGQSVKQTVHRKEKRFCSTACRMKYWNKHPEEMKHKNSITTKCKNCGKAVIIYRKTPRIYCSHACAMEGRRIGKENH